MDDSGNKRALDNDADTVCPRKKTLVKPLQDEDVCERCAAIPWQQIATSLGNPEKISILIHEHWDHKILEACRTCRFVEV
jgi:hypothetical protein